MSRHHDFPLFDSLAATSSRAGLGVASTAAVTALPCPRMAWPVCRHAFRPTPSVTPSPGQRVVEKTLTAKPVSLDPGGRTVATGPTTAPPRPGDPRHRRRLPAPHLDNQPRRRARSTGTAYVCKCRRRRARLDLAPGQDRRQLRHEFTAPDPGTYFFHPHVGVQLDRGLYAPLIIDDPREPGGYDAEWVLVLDDWIDGTSTTPDEVLANSSSTAVARAARTWGWVAWTTARWVACRWVPGRGRRRRRDLSDVSDQRQTTNRPRCSQPDLVRGSGCASSTLPPTQSSALPSVAIG